MAGFTTLTNIPLSIKAKIDATVLMDPEANYVYALTALQKSMPMHSGDTLRFPKYSRPSAFTTPLAESELDIDPQTLSKTFIDAQINYYGTYFLISERTVDQNPEDVLRVHAGALNSALRETEDILTRETLLTTTTNIRCVAGENGDNPTEVTEKDFSTVISTLTGYIAKPITSQISGSNKFGTAPVAQAFIGIFHPDLIPDFEAMPNFKTIDQYGSSYKPLPSEWGAYSRVRFLETTQAPKETTTSALDHTVYSTVVLGRDAFSIIKQDSKTAKIVGPKKVGALEDKYQYGIKTVFSAALLFDQHVANVTSTRSTELV
jgi:N4-gp56 family major capsid protein